MDFDIPVVQSRSAGVEKTKTRVEIKDIRMNSESILLNLKRISGM
jgi:hypothetical protein